MENAPIKTLIVDDEPLARDLLRSFAAKDSCLQIVGECANGAEALSAINAHQPDLVFLDVQMPVLDGIGVVERLLHRKTLPHIVFVTAFDQYAVKAFELNVMDYLLKPVEKTRFYPLVEKIKATIRREQICDLAERMFGAVSSYKNTSVLQPSEDSILINTGQKLVSLTAQDIIWVEAANQYVTIHTANDQYVMSENLGQFSARLNALQFLRIHRSALINLAYVTSVARAGNGTHKVTLKNGAVVLLARGRADMLPRLLEAARLP